MKWKWKVALAGLALILAAVWWAAWRQPAEPEYEGQPLSDYLSSLTYSQVRLERDARDAVPVARQPRPCRAGHARLRHAR